MGSVCVQCALGEKCVSFNETFVMLQTRLFPDAASEMLSARLAVMQHPAPQFATLRRGLLTCFRGSPGGRK